MESPVEATTSPATPEVFKPEVFKPEVSKPRVYGLLSTLSVVQFTAFSFFSFGLIAILRQRGVGFASLGLIQFALVIPALRFVWAPLVDRYGSRRSPYRSWLLALMPALALAAAAMSLVQPERRLGTTLALVMVVAVLGATTNTAADALTVRLLDDKSRGIGNGLRVAGGYGGTLISGGVLLVIYDHAGWRVTLLVFTALALLPMLLLFGFREPRRDARADLPSLLHGFAGVVAVLRQPGAARWALGVLPLYWTGVYSASALVDPMLVDAHWSLSRIALVVNTPAEIVALCAGLGAGLLLVRLGRRRALLIGGASQVLAVAALLPLAYGIVPDIPTSLAVCAIKASYAISATVVTTVSMTFCRPDSAGTDAGVMAAVGSAVTAACSALALPVAGLTGYPAAVGACVVIAVAATLIARRLAPTG